MEMQKILGRACGVLFLIIGLSLLAPVTQAVEAALPQSCQDIVTNNPGAPDGDYTIFPNNKTFTVYCYDMAGTPKEYLTLANTNFSQYTAGGPSPGTDVRTDYTKVRLNPLMLLIDIGDQTFATSTGLLYHGPDPVTSMPYGVAMDCLAWDSTAGIGKIDLTGTPFAVSDLFNVGGFHPAGSATFSANNQVVDLAGGGFCGWITADPFLYNPTGAQGGFRLDLAFLDADNDGITDADDLCSDTSIPETVPTVRLGVNRFALTEDGDGFTFDTTAPNGTGPQKSFTLADTAGCSCEQIIEQLDLGKGHKKYGCSISAMEDWINSLNP